MSNVIGRVERLKARVKRKCDEIYHYLDISFYDQCRSILQTVRKLDTGDVFSNNPTRLPDYSLRVSCPMWWKRIEARLAKYEYTAVSEFVDDMRLVVQNCYDYNGETSPISALGRRIEVKMEDLFVTELAIEPPDPREIIRLGKHVERAQARQLWEVICLYEDYGKEKNSVRQHVVPSQLKCATQRRAIFFLRRLAATGGQKSRTEKTVPTTPAAAPVPSSRRVDKPRFPTRDILDADDDVSFVEEQGLVQGPSHNPPQLERVPQNQRTGFSSFSLVSPVVFNEGFEDVQFNEEKLPSGGEVC
uniref:Predicted bromodomain protein n=1 Tax=Trypanosoma congolense (strain IL3000) TaxID=1068625 RepID=G0UX13_TRYCI|nr:predicted bromodomain protein [Trypanosoma congolense IL3000]